MENIIGEFSRDGNRVPKAPSPGLEVAGEEMRDPDLAEFRAAYTSGEGLAYVVIKDERRGEQIYRYGDASRLTARKDARGYMLFTCASPHVFLASRPDDKAVLKKARVVKAGAPEFADLDAKYLASCRNPLVKSAQPKATR